MKYRVVRRATASRLGKFTAKSRRKRASTTTLAKYQKPTARNQRTQIMRNARSIARLNRSVYTNRVFCDFQQEDTLFAKLDAGNYTTTWGCFALTDFTQWDPCLRKDQNVLESSKTFIQRMQLNLRYTLASSDWAQFNVFIVTNRKDAANRDWPVTIDAGQNPVNGTDYIEGPLALNIRLNPSLFKVHYASYRTLTETTLLESAPSPPLTAGNPFSTWAKGQVTVKPNYNVRVPVSGETQNWRNVRYMAQPYYKRYFLLVAIVQNAPTATQLNDGARFDFDQLATTINDA